MGRNKQTTLQTAMKNAKLKSKINNNNLTKQKKINSGDDPAQTRRSERKNPLASSELNPPIDQIVIRDLNGQDDPKETDDDTNKEELDPETVSTSNLSTSVANLATGNALSTKLLPGSSFDIGAFITEYQDLKNKIIFLEEKAVQNEAESKSLKMMLDHGAQSIQEFIRPTQESTMLISSQRLIDAKRSTCYRTFVTRILTAFTTVEDVYMHNLRGRASTIDKNAPRKIAFSNSILEEIYNTTYSIYKNQIDALVKLDKKHCWKTQVNTCVTKKLQKLNKHFRSLIDGKEDDSITREDIDHFRDYEKFSKNPVLFGELDKQIEKLRPLAIESSTHASTNTKTPVQKKEYKKQEDISSSSDSDTDDDEDDDLLENIDLFGPSSEDDESDTDEAKIKKQLERKKKSSKQFKKRDHIDIDEIRKREKELKRLKRMYQSANNH